MPYEPYADSTYYTEVYQGNLIPEDCISNRLRTASRHIDSLTFNRILSRGLEGLTNYQKELIREVCCEIAEFEHENADMIDSVLQSYAINGVSMSFGESWNLKVENGVAVRKDTYAKLQGTGLTNRILR